MKWGDVIDTMRIKFGLPGNPSRPTLDQVAAASGLSVGALRSDNPTADTMAAVDRAFDVPSGTAARLYWEERQ